MSLNKILDLLLLVEKERKAQGCPVCGKTLYADEVSLIDFQVSNGKTGK